MPGRRWRAGSIPEASTMLTSPLKWRSAATTTASFSMGFREHVEYTSRPPGRSSIRPRIRMRSWRACRPVPFMGVQSFQIARFLRSVPSPEHGTSARMRSYLSSRCSIGSDGCSPFHETWMFGMLLASTLVTQRLGDGRRWDWCTSMWARFVSESFATTTPRGIGSKASGDDVRGE